jgi:uncharacterized delta-60 repeat protein
LIATAASAALLILRPAAAAPGDADRSFGTAGTVETTIGTESAATELALQPDGRIVVHGSSRPGGSTLARYDPNGRLDAGFGAGGIVTGQHSFASGLALQPDGKILVSTQLSGQRTALLRYERDGTLDPGFGSAGLATGPRGGARALAVQPDGKIVAVGTAADAYAFQVARFNTDGSLDTGFGTGGAVQTVFGYSAVAATVALKPDGRIVVAGDSIPGIPRPPPPPPPAPPPPPPPTPPPERIVLAQYQPNGNLDQSFGSGGMITAPIGRRSRASDLGLQPDGRILVAGSSDARIVVARYSPEGLLDPGFGSSGVVLGRPESAGYLSSALALQPDGKIVIGGSNTLARYLPNGKPDPTFGTNGIVTSLTSMGVANALALQPDGRILAAGFNPSRRPERFTLSRFHASFPTTIEAGLRTIRFGQTTKVAGTLTPAQVGAVVKILERDCNRFSTRVAARATADSRGRWSLRLRPGSRATIQAEVNGELSAALAVQVRPRLTLEKISGGRFRARVVAGGSLGGRMVVLQRFSRGHWVGARRVVVRRTAKRGRAVISEKTFGAPNTKGRRLRLFFRRSGDHDCYASAASRPITG